ncbi:U-box domain-containing protein 10-like isoform X1 [Andrographis paniculata]|uniref:U-box domain-containing protein 10-like isoform X1 n=1 Tax=Andrographis paniculata TaxID=175694 RepID=UPI0021E87F30|nr:U-box domain-containing protein 10-like isoform X1 [Andrographis paniculata]
MATPVDLSAAALTVIGDVSRISAAGFSGFFKKDCADLARKLSLLSHLVEEIKNSGKFSVDYDFRTDSSSLLASGFSDLNLVLHAAKELLSAANNFDDSELSGDGRTKKIFFQFQCVTGNLEKALANIPYDCFGISEEVVEQVDLIRAQLRRSVERYGGALDSIRASDQLQDKENNPSLSGKKLFENLHLRNIVYINAIILAGGCGITFRSSDEVTNLEKLQNLSTSSDVNVAKDSPSKDSLVIPDEFRCPISLEIMRDPVIVATGQTYERVYIQRWVDGGNTTCPKTQQKLKNLTLTPNFVLRNLISQWCEEHKIEHPMPLVNGRIKQSDGTFRDVTADIIAIGDLVRKLSSLSIEERRAAVAEIRSLSKRSTDNRILLAEAGAVPILVKLLMFNDRQIRDNAVTCLLNLSIYGNNKGLIMLADAVPSLVEVVASGSAEAKANAAATLFSLSLVDENKIIIGGELGAIPALVDLLRDGNPEGKRDAATALFNLCMYQGNKGRAVRAGIIGALMKMLTDSMEDEALTILSILVGHHDAKAAIGKTSMIPALVDRLRRGGLPRNQENAAAILLSLCKRDEGNREFLIRLGAVVPLSEIADSGTERGRRKAAALLEVLRQVRRR